MKMKITTEITIYEVDSKTTAVVRPQVTIKSHWSRNEMVILRLDDKDITVKASDLKKAIENATNWSLV